MKISRNWLQTYFDKPIPSADELDELFTFRSFEVEGMEKVGGDDVLDVKVLPDRAHYALSHKGIALEVSVLTGQPLKSDRIPKGPDVSMDAKPTIRIEASQFCRRYVGRYAELPSVAPSNPHACAMLEAIGERAINSVVDATNICMFDIGQPLHAFDADQVKGTIVVRVARKGEKITLLDSAAGKDREVELLETDHVIADDLGAIAIAGVKGGKRAGVTDMTRHLIIESANFEPTAVRRTSTRLNLRSESSKRYENEITPEIAAPTMDSVCALILHNNPGAKFGPVVDEYPVKAKQTIIDFDPAYAEERLGVAVPLGEARSILERMGVVITEKGKLWSLVVPFDRLDLTISDDIVEEIGRIYGYEHVKGILPPKTDKPVTILPSFYIAEKIKNILVGQGFSEVSLSSLVSKGEVETAYPLARDKSFARANLTDGMMSCVEKNALNADLLGLDAIKIFEIGRIFTREGEKAMLSIGVMQIKKTKGLNSKKLLDGTLETLSGALDISSSTAKQIENGKSVVCEIGLDALLKDFKPGDSYSDLKFGLSSINRYRKFSQYPFIVRDIAVFVPESMNDGVVWQAIEAGIKAADASTLLVRHSLFDTFKKDGKISYAFRMVFQSMDRTLTDDEANKAMKSIYSEVKANGWEVR